MARITIEVGGLGAARKRLRALVDAGHDATPQMREITEYLLTTTGDRFAADAGPDGGFGTAAMGMGHPSYGTNRIGQRAITRTEAVRELPE